MALEGTIKDFNLPDIFQLISLQQKSGVLVLKGTEEVVTVYFHKGMIVSADSSKARLEDRLGFILVKSGKLRQEKLNECLQEQKETLKRLGSILLKHKLISREEMKEVLISVISQKVYPVFRWEEGEYHFSQEEDIDYDNDSFAPIKTDNFLMEAAQIMDEWPLIKRKLTGFDQVFKQKIDEEQLSKITASSSDDTDALPTGTDGTIPASIIELTQEEKKIYDLIDGKRTTRDLVEELYDLSEFEIFRTIYDLLERNLVVPVEGEKPIVPAAPPKKKRLYLVLKSAVYALLLTVVFYVIFLTESGITGFLSISTEDAYVSSINRSASYNRLEKLSYAVKLFYLNHNRLPENLDELLRAGLIGKKDKVDPWGRIYAYVRHGDRFSLIGYNKDGIMDYDLVITVDQPLF